MFTQSVSDDCRCLQALDSGYHLGLAEHAQGSLDVFGFDHLIRLVLYGAVWDCLGLSGAVRGCLRLSVPIWTAPGFDLSLQSSI